MRQVAPLSSMIFGSRRLDYLQFSTGLVHIDFYILGPALTMNVYLRPGIFGRYGDIVRGGADNRPILAV